MKEDLRIGLIELYATEDGTLLGQDCGIFTVL